MQNCGSDQHPSWQEGWVGRWIGGMIELPVDEIVICRSRNKINSVLLVGFEMIIFV